MYEDHADAECDDFSQCSQRNRRHFPRVKLANVLNFISHSIATNLHRRESNG